MPPRFRAFLIHLVLSGILGVGALGLVFKIWYPAPLHHAVGVQDVVLLLLGVDVIVGPLLTGLVYNESKKSLRFDLTAIVVLQLSAFFYGMSVVAEGRPAWLVFNVDRFDLVQVYEVDSRELEQTEVRYRTPSWFGPQWVSAHIPQEIEKRNKVTFEAVFAGVDIAQRPDLYKPLIAADDAIRQHLLPLGKLNDFNSPERVADVLKSWPEADGYIPMMARVRPMTVLIDKASARVIAVVDLTPWL